MLYTSNGERRHTGSRTSAWVILSLGEEPKQRTFSVDKAWLDHTLKHHMVSDNTSIVLPSEAPDISLSLMALSYHSKCKIIGFFLSAWTFIPILLQSFLLWCSLPCLPSQSNHPTASGSHFFIWELPSDSKYFINIALVYPFHCCLHCCF